MEGDMGTCRQGHIVTFEQLQGISHAGLYRTSRLSRQESCWAIPVPSRERAAGIHIIVSPRTCLHVLSCLTGSTGELLQFPFHALFWQHSPFPQHDGAGCSTAAIPGAGSHFPTHAVHRRSPRDVCGRGKAGALHLASGSSAGRPSWLSGEAALGVSRALASSLENGAQAGTALLRRCQVERQEGRKETGTRQQSTETSRKMGL